MRRNLFLGLSAAVLAGVLAMPAPARADVITYNDLTDTISVSHDGTDTTITGSCSAVEGTFCSLTLSRGSQGIEGLPRAFLLAEDPRLQVFSDEISLDSTQALVAFESSAGEGAVPCTQVSGIGCQAQETGQPQGFTITWSGGGTDSIFIRSDPEPGSTSVPEPGTLALFAAALAGLGLTRRRRRSWQERDRG